jgi:hypothetical protein
MKMVDLLKNALILLVLILFLMTCAACGYSISAKGVSTGTAFNSLAIPLFESPSTDRGVEADFTGIIRNEFIKRSKVPIVSSEKADAIISGRIYKIDTQPIAYDTVTKSAGGSTVSYKTNGTRKMIIKLDVTLTDRSTGKILWHDGSMEEEANFEVSEDPLENRNNKDQAIKEIAGQIAKKIYLNTMGRF